jgi:hypothetical protein
VNNKWIRYNLDGTLHVDQRKQQQKQPQTTTDNRSAAAAEQMSKEIAAIRAQLLVLVGRLDRLEQESQK